MNERTTVVLLGASQERHALAAAALANTASVVREFAATGGPTKIVLVDLAGDLERGLRTIGEVRQTMPAAQVVAVAASKDSEVILRAMRAGACEFALLSDARELEAMVHVLAKKTAREEPSGTVVSVFPAKGGVGATTIATNLACASCVGDRRVLLVDFDRHSGDVLAFLDMAPHQSIADVVKNLHRLDRELLLSSIARHASGVYVLAHSESLEEGDTVSASQVTALLQLAARHFDLVVCDGLGGFDEASVAVLDASSRVELVLTQDVITLKNAKRCLELFHRLGYGRDKVELLVNRFHSKAAIDLDALVENLGLEVRSTIANDYGAVIAATNRGVPVASAAPKSKVASDVAVLAARLSGVEHEKRRGFLGGFFRRSEPARADLELGEKGGYDVTRRSPKTA